jgi:hypothetical protein
MVLQAVSNAFGALDIRCDRLNGRWRFRFHLTLENDQSSYAFLESFRMGSGRFPKQLSRMTRPNS